MAAILQSANILANNSQMYQNANARIFDAITQAANAYEERQRLKAAALEKERERAAAQQAAQQDIMLNPEKAIMQIQTKASTGAPLTPQEQATLQTAKGVLSSKQNVDQYGRPYRAYDFSAMGTADVMAPVPASPMVQSEELPASPVGQVMSMRPPAENGLLPPPAALSAGEQRMPASEFTQEAPAPIGEAAPKASAVGSVRPPKMIQGAAGPIADPVDLERYKAELAAAKESDVKGAESEAEKRKAQFNLNKSFGSLVSDFGNIASKVDRAVSQSNRFNTGAFAGKAGEGESRKTTGEGFLGSGFLTGGVNLNNTLKTIEADSAFSALQDMRANSPTGGALGGIAVRELELLGAAKQSLDQSQTEEQLDYNLKEYKRIRTNAVRNVAEAYKEQFGEYPRGYEPKMFVDVTNIPQGAIDKLKSNPSLRDAFEAKYGAGSASKVLGR